ncbi:MAG: sulfatase-like hydrolase/transferase [Hominimerdicola sp.]
MTKFLNIIKKNADSIYAFVIMVAAFVTGASFLLAYYWQSGEEYKRLNGIYNEDMWHPKFCLFISIVCLLISILGVWAIINFRKGKGKLSLNRYYISVLLAVNSAFLPEFVMDCYPMKSNIIYNILGIFLCLILYLMGSLIFQKPKIYYCIVSGFFSAYSVAQFYVGKFRGGPIQFADLYNIQSCFEIKSEYKFTAEFMPVYAILNFIGIIALMLSTEVKVSNVKCRLIGIVPTVVLGGILIFGGNFAFDLGIKNRYIKLNFSDSENTTTYQNIGFNLMFYFDGMYNRVEKPENYSDEKAEEILSGYETEKADKKPVIIAIMNESFADFEHINEFETNKDYLPNYNKLKEESVYGYVTVSAYGGYSCNSEYEFLTGNTLGFLPSGSAVFTQYLNNKQDGLVSYLNELGYSTIALSPCTEGLWNIGEAYDNLQFDTRIYNCQKEAYLPEFINDNLSDESLYKIIEKKYRSMNGKPFFLWTATMQNHGPYDKNSKDGTVDKEITITDYDSFEAEQYLNSIYQSDKALGELMDYFRDAQDEVIIVMFGDHYPHIIDFTEYLYGRDISLLSTEEYSKLHQTPFIIWSNKGTESKEIQQISLNYLSNEVLKTAGIPLAPYQQELEKIREKLPVISSFGYMTDKNEWYYINDTAQGYEDIMNEYHTMQYYRMFAQ